MLSLSGRFSPPPVGGILYCMDVTGHSGRQSPARLRVVVFGRVQGVWFRASTKRMAEGLGLAGWVRNRSDGAVEAAVEGDPIAVQSAVEWCHDGPDLATVDEVEIHAEPAEGLLGFSIRG